MKSLAASVRGQHSRRTFLAGSAATLAAAGKIAAQQPTAACARCGGLKFVPLADADPFVWTLGTPQPQGNAAVGEQPCPVCQPQGETTNLAAEAQERITATIENHRQWEEKTGWKLVLAVTRHAAVSTQLTPVQAKSVGTALETFTLHLKRLTGSLALTPTRPNSYEILMLWEKESWDHFREVMEGLYTRDQLGEFWGSARGFNSYDHLVTPHLYDTPQSIRTRPPSCGAVFLLARRQINIATNWHAPLWLAEGFSAYGDYIVHKVNRWYSVYDKSRVPTVGDWMVTAKRLVSDKKLRPWPKMLKRELRDWEPADYAQSMGMVAFLLESEPQKFLDFTSRLRAGESDESALETVCEAQLDEIESRCSRWLLARR
jgi:hypothetical protein